MLTRITRYTLLVLCLLVAGVWGSSYVRTLIVQYWSEQDVQAIHLNCGAISFQRLDHTLISDLPQNPGLDLDASQQPDPTAWDQRGTGLWMDHFVHSAIGTQSTTIEVRMWPVLLVLIIITAALWYRPIRNRLRGKGDAGFAVEPKQSDRVA